MKNKTKLLILSVIASLAFTGAMASCGKKGGGNNDGASSTASTDVSSEITSSEIGGSESEITSSTPVVEEITVSINGAASVKEFETITLMATVSGTDEEPTIEWTSSDDSIATVDADGVVTGHKAGEVTITATAGDVSATHTVTVAKTDILHEIEFDINEVRLYEGEMEFVEASVTFGGETLDNDEYNLEYKWEKVNGDDVATIEADGASVKFVATAAGTATYKVSTTARGYVVEDTITVTVMENEYSYKIDNEKISAGESGYKTTLTLISDTTLEIGKVYGVKNGEPTEDELTVTWATESDSLTLENGVITATKAGSGVITGTTTYGGEALEINLVVTIEKNKVSLQDTMTIETVNASTLTLPADLNGTVEKITLGSGVLFDAAAAKGSIAGNVVTVDAEGIPCKTADLGKGKTLTVETDTSIYAIPANVYTMIINTVEELDQWQEVASENAVKEGACIEEQKGLIYTGYFILGDDIEYNKVWAPYKSYAQLWALCYNNKNIWKDQSKFQANKYPTKVNEEAVDGAIEEDWGLGANAGFKGTFDGDGHYISGLQTSGDYSGFVVTLGLNGVIENVAFLNATVGAGAGYVFHKGQGTVRNVYVDVAKMENGKDQDKVTTIAGKAGASGERSLENIVVDVSKVDYKNLEFAYVIDLSMDDANGIYVLGAEDALFARGTNGWTAGSDDNGAWEATQACVFWHYAEGKDVGGSYANAAALMASENGEGVKAWTNPMWLINDNALIAKSAVEVFGGDVTVTNTETEISANGSLALTADKDERYIVYTLKEANDKISINGNVVSVASDAEVGSTFTIVATSALDGKTDEITLSVGKFLEKATAENAVSVNLGLTVSESTVVKAETAAVDLSEIYDTYLAGKTVTVKYGDATVYEGAIESASWNMPLTAFGVTDSGAASLVFTYEVTEKKGEITLPISVVQNEIELNSTNVTSAAALQSILNSNPYGNFKLTSDISLNGGLKAVAAFHGTFDGQGHIIKKTHLHHDADTNGYNPRLFIENTGTIKNVGFELDYITYTTGGRQRGIVNVNKGTLENIYVSVALTQQYGATQTDTSYFRTGVIAQENAGTINNVLVEVTVAEGITFYDKTIAAVAFNNNATVTNAFVIVNNPNATEEKPNNVVAIVNGSADGATVYNAWHEADATAISDMGALWTAEGKEIYFGGTLIGDTTMYTLINKEYKTDVNKQVVLESDRLTKDSVWTMTINGNTSEVTVTEAGKLTVTIDPATISGYQTSVELKNDAEAISFSNIIAVTYITNLEELKTLSMGENNKAATGDLKGYYALANDITITHQDDMSDVIAAGYHMAGHDGTNYTHKYSFRGIFDGNGYTIDNARVSDGGLFGWLGNATIKNFNLTNVSILDNVAQTVSNQRGGYVGLLGFAIDGTVTIKDVNITIKKTATGDSWKRDSLLICTGSGGGKGIYENITIDAGGLKVKTLFGTHFNPAQHTFTNVVIKAESYNLVAYTKDTVTADVVNVTELPAGVTFVKDVTPCFVGLDGANNSNSNGDALPVYTGDVTALGFAAGTTVYERVEDNRTNAWASDGDLGVSMENQAIRLNKATDEDYASVQFSISREFTAGQAFFCWYWKDDARLAGVYLKPDGTQQGTAEGVKVVAYDMEGNVATKFEVGKVYEMRWYGEGANAFRVGCCEPNGITIYYANPSSGNDAE